MSTQYLNIRTFLASAILIVSQLALTPTAFAANSCSDVAKSLQSQHGGKVLSVQQRKNSCVIDLLVPGQNDAPPRKKRFTVKL